MFLLFTMILNPIVICTVRKCSRYDILYSWVSFLTVLVVFLLSLGRWVGKAENVFPRTHYMLLDKAVWRGAIKQKRCTPAVIGTRQNKQGWLRVSVPHISQSRCRLSGIITSISLHYSLFITACIYLYITITQCFIKLSSRSIYHHLI